MGRAPLANGATTLFWVGEDGQVHARFSAPSAAVYERSTHRRVYRGEPTFVRLRQLETDSDMDCEYKYTIEDAREVGPGVRRA